MRRIRWWLSDRKWKRQMEAERKAENRNERRRLLRGKEELVEAVYAILYEFDPMGINFGDNPTEYDQEAEAIVLRAKLNSDLTLDELTDIVYEEFVHWFNAESAGQRDSYSGIAVELRSQGLL